MNPQALQAAFGRPPVPEVLQNVAERSQAAMLEPINRYKSAMGRATTPAMQEALRRQTSPQNVAPEVPQTFAQQKPLSYYTDMWQRFHEDAPTYANAWRNLPGRYFESNPGYLRTMSEPTAT